MIKWKIEKKWPDDPMIVPVKNGIIFVKDRTYKMALNHGYRHLPVDYDNSADKSPHWQEFLDQVLPGSEGKQSQRLLQKFFGYCLLRNAHFPMMLIFYGTGANGKSVVLRVLSEMVGANNALTYSIRNLGKLSHVKHLQNIMINVSDNEGAFCDYRQIDIRHLAAAIYGCPVENQHKYDSPIIFPLYTKMIISTNIKPVISKNSHGIANVCKVINFPRQFQPHEVNAQLADSLLQEINQIFTWALTGLYSLLDDNGFEP